jgi:hypothetical protein
VNPPPAPPQAAGDSAANVAPPLTADMNISAHPPPTGDILLELQAPTNVDCELQHPVVETLAINEIQPDIPLPAEDVVTIDNAHLDNIINDVGDLVATDAQEGVKSILESVRGMMTPEQLTRAVNDFKISIPKLQGDAVFAAIAGSLQAASEMSTPVMKSVGAAVLVLGAHLPYIAIAAGAIGAIIYTFQMSKDYDENVKNVSCWMSSVKDWLMLVAAKIAKSGADSTIPLFEGLQAAMLALNSQVDNE